MNPNNTTIILTVIFASQIFINSHVFAENKTEEVNWEITVVEGTWASSIYKEGGIPLLCNKLKSVYLNDDMNNEKHILAYCYQSGIAVNQDLNVAIAILEMLSQHGHSGSKEVLTQLRPLAKKRLISVSANEETSLKPHQMNQAFEYKKSGIIIGLELNNKGAALMVINESKKLVSISPKEIQITTKSGVITPCTIHHMSMFGIGSPLLSISVKPGEKEGFILSACEPLGEALIVAKKVTSVNIAGYQIPRVDEFNKN